MGYSVTPEVLELLDSAEALRAADQPVEAIDKLEEALRLEGPLEASVAAEIRLRLSDCHTDVSNHAAAQEVVDAVIRQAPDETWHARALIRLARAKCFLGDLETSADISREALRALAGTAMHADTAMAMQWLGNAWQESGEIAEAHEIFRDAVALARLSEDKFRLASCLGSVARLNIQRSQYREARTQYEECATLAEALGHRKEVASVHLNLSVCLFYLGDWIATDREIGLAHRLFGELNHLLGGALCKLALSKLARRRGEDPTSLLAEATQLAEQSEYRRARLLAIEERADIAREAGDIVRAETEYERLLQLSAPDSPGGDISYEVRARLALVRLASGHPAEAEQLAEKALESATRALDLREESFCRTALARIHQNLGHGERAVSEINEAIRILEKLEIPYELAQAYETADEITPRPRLRERAQELYRSLGLAAAQPPPTRAVEERFVAVAPKMKHLVDKARELGELQTTVLLTGETGVGKSLFAKLIHETSSRAEATFGVLNCANWSASRVESGRAPDPVDLFERAANGTVLLKSVDKARPELQEVLIGALESAASDADAARDGAGTPGEEAAQLQVISTTSEDVEHLVERGRLREEFYYRLAGLVVDIPPLRERGEDVPELARRFAGRTLSDDVLQALRKHAWRGNVRELQNTLRAAVFSAGDEPLAREHLPESITEQHGSPQSLPERIEALERREIGAALERTRNNKRVAARELGISRKGLIDRLKRLGMWEEYGRIS